MGTSNGVRTYVRVKCFSPGSDVPSFAWGQLPATALRIIECHPYDTAQLRRRGSAQKRALDCVWAAAYRTQAEHSRL